jgi:hypothetical protein
VQAELEPYLRATPVGADDFAGRHTRRTGALIARSPTCRDLITHPLVLETTRQLLAGATNFQLHLTQVIAIGPGAEAQTIHRDQWAFDFFSFPPGYEVQCNTIWAMSDFSEANGATRVVAGSNKAADKLQFAVADSEPAEMKKGSVLVYTGSVYHGGGANRSDQTRYAINITYNRAWLRQEENQYLSVPREIARELPKDLQRLMGYALGAYALGYIDDVRDPIAALDPQRADEGFGDAGPRGKHAAALETRRGSQVPDPKSRGQSPGDQPRTPPAASQRLIISFASLGL